MFNNAAVRVDFPEDGSPRSRICFAGIDLEDETESRIDDHKSCGGASGEVGLESFMVYQTVFPPGGGGRPEPYVAE